VRRRAGVIAPKIPRVSSTRGIRPFQLWRGGSSHVDKRRGALANNRPACNAIRLVDGENEVRNLAKDRVILSRTRGFGGIQAREPPTLSGRGGAHGGEATRFLERHKEPRRVVRRKKNCGFPEGVRTTARGRERREPLPPERSKLVQAFKVGADLCKNRGCPYGGRFRGRIPILHGGYSARVVTQVAKERT